MALCSALRLPLGTSMQTPVKSFPPADATRGRDVRGEPMVVQAVDAAVTLDQRPVAGGSLARAR